MHMNCEVSWDMLTANRLKDNQFAMDGQSIISKTLETQGESKVKLEHMHVKTTKGFEETNASKGKMMILECDK